MSSYHHRAVKRFHLDGIIHDDSALVRLREEYGRLIDTEMRMSGYVPRLDIPEDFTIEYNTTKQYFEFELSIYGIYVGKKKSQWIYGIDGTVVLHILQNKSNEYSQEQASP
jgi:hypothetical protein